jgi:4-hydroxy-tetrahydrodipicolinate synthase
MTSTAAPNAPYGRVLTAMVTPFEASGAIDFDRLARLSHYLINNGSEGLVATGTTGESPTLSSPETVAVWRGVMDAVGGKVPVLAGTGTNDTAHTIEMSVAAAEQGVDAVLVVSPYYNRPDQRGLFAHFTAVADACDVPVVLYNIPGRSACLIEVDTLVRLAEHPNIIGVKDAVDDLGFSKRALSALPTDFAVYSGSDDLTLELMASGAVGIISVASHLVGRQIAEMASLVGIDIAAARELEAKLMGVFKACFLEPSPQPLKGALNVLWEPVGDPRLPLVRAEQDTIDRLVHEVQEVTQR